jgi:biotin-(acetyl-CoA carboxylase) ligase
MKFFDPEWYDNLYATNTVLLEWLKDGVSIPNGFVLAAVGQTAGHGRCNRHWVSQAGRDLAFSILHFKIKMLIKKTRVQLWL